MWWPTGPLGRRGERHAAGFLRRKGCRILARSYRCPLGEIDLVAELGDLVLFVEVKTRASDRHGSPSLAVHRDKRQRITRSAVYFLKARRRLDAAVRFDIVSIVWPPGWFVRPIIEHFEGAFDADGPWST